METSRTKIYFASDAHLGARFHADPRAVEKKLVRWLDSIKQDASAVWFLGDMFDYWYEYKYVVPKGFTRFLGKLAELADNGVEIHIFIGNHDIWMFDYLPQEIGAIIHREPLTVDLLGKRFFLAHGDEVDYRSRAFRVIRQCVPCNPSDIPESFLPDFIQRHSSPLDIRFRFRLVTQQP